VAVSRELGLPVKLVGIGEGLEDLRDVSVNALVPTEICVRVERY
jgi:signal recognition particle GTPase